MAVSQASQGGQAGNPPVLVLVLDGLIDRMQRSPLMRRAPSQCSPEEQRELAMLLADLLALRQARASAESVPSPRVEQVQLYWPELAAMLAPPRRGGAATRPRSREVVGTSDGAGLFEGMQSVDSTTPGDDAAPELPAEATPAEGGGAESSTTDLAHLLLEALTVQGRALNTTQMLAWLAERGTQATREQVTTTLFRHEELFRKRGAGHWVIAGPEAS